MSNELIEVDSGGIAPLADNFLVQLAEQAEKRIDAVIKIKQCAIKVTNATDWTDQQGKPYLQVSGSEKIANLFGISWRIDEAVLTEEEGGHFTYSVKGCFSLGGRSIEVEGTRSSKDPFFKKYEYATENGKKVRKGELPPSTIDRGDVKKAALTNLFGNGITRMLGIRNMTWDDLAKFSGITQAMVLQKVSYEGSGGKRAVTMPTGKSDKPATPPAQASAPTQPNGKKTPAEYKSEIQRMIGEVIDGLNPDQKGDDQFWEVEFVKHLRSLTVSDYEKNGEQKHFDGYEDINKISDKALPIIYGHIKTWHSQQMSQINTGGLPGV